MNINPYNANDTVYNEKKLIQVSDMTEYLTYINRNSKKFKIRDKEIISKSFQGNTTLRKIYIPASCLKVEAKTPQEAPFYGCSPYLTIFTEFTEDEVPKEWGPYWNYYSDSETLVVFYGSSMTLYQNAAMKD